MHIFQSSKKSEILKEQKVIQLGVQRRLAAVSFQCFGTVGLLPVEINLNHFGCFVDHRSQVVHSRSKESNQKAITVSQVREVSQNLVQRPAVLALPENSLKVDSSDTKFSSFSSIAQSCPTLCDPMNYSMPGLPVHHQLPELCRAIILFCSPKSLRLH